MNSRSTRHHIPGPRTLRISMRWTSAHFANRPRHPKSLRSCNGRFLKRPQWKSFLSWAIRGTDAINNSAALPVTSTTEAGRTRPFCYHKVSQRSPVLTDLVPFDVSQAHVQSQAAAATLLLPMTWTSSKHHTRVYSGLRWNT